MSRSISEVTFFWLCKQKIFKSIYTCVGSQSDKVAHTATKYAAHDCKLASKGKWLVTEYDNDARQAKCTFFDLCTCADSLVWFKPISLSNCWQKLPTKAIGLLPPLFSEWICTQINTLSFFPKLITSNCCCSEKIISSHVAQVTPIVFHTIDQEMFWASLRQAW